jgi:hypothetical protein
MLWGGWLNGGALECLRFLQRFELATESPDRFHVATVLAEHPRERHGPYDGIGNTGIALRVHVAAQLVVSGCDLVGQ